MSKFPIPDVALARHIAVVGETGSGKTHDTKTIVEHVVGEGYRVCVLDTIKSDWWGITSSANGKRPGLPFKIIGGPRGHVPLHSGAGKAIGQLVGEGKLPLSIIDMADLEPGGPQRFFEHFAQALWKHMRGVIYLVIEEAHELAPKERSGFGAENMAIHWAKKLATGSRTKGIRLIIASQRTQAVHNALLGSCGTLLAHSLSLPADQKPIIDWLNANVRDKALRGAIEEDLAFLPTGTAWACCAKDNFFQKVRFPAIATFDNSATPDKDADEFDVTTAPVNPDELRAIIGDAVKDAEANDPKALKAEIGKLKAEIGKLSVSRPAAPDNKAYERSVEAARKEGFGEGYGQGWTEGDRTGFARGAGVALDQGFGAVRDALKAFAGVQFVPGTPPKRAHSLHSAPLQRVVTGVPATAAREVANPAPRAPRSDTGLEAPLQRIIDAIKWWNVIGVNAPSPAQVGFIAKYAPTGGTWTTYLSRLRTRGLLAARGDLALTPEGHEAANHPEDLPTGEILRERILGMLDAPLQKILRPLIAAYPDSLSAAEAGEQSGYAPTGGTWTTYLSRLRSRELIERRGDLKAQDWMFP